MDNRSWLKIAPDKQYLIVEERLRFPVAADLEPTMVPFAVFKDLQKSIDILEKHRGWKLITTAPKRKQFPGGKPCCAAMATAPVGTTLNIKFMPSDLQGDTDDAHNFGELSDPNKRMFVENIVDWVAIMHFWVPGIVVNTDADKEYSQSLRPESGFIDNEALSKLRKQLEAKKNG